MSDEGTEVCTCHQYPHSWWCGTPRAVLFDEHGMIVLDEKQLDPIAQRLRDPWRPVTK